MTIRYVVPAALAALALTSASSASAAKPVFSSFTFAGGSSAGSRSGNADSHAGVDEFGVTMLYPTAPGGETWALGEDATNDPRFDPQQEITRNEDGSWKMVSDKVRMNVFTSTGYDPSALETDREVLAERGYMQAPNDWKNVEITGYMKVNSVAAEDDNFSWYTRGGRHNDDNACEGSAYKGGLYYDGRVRVQKESWHVSYEQTEYDTATSSIVGRWVGFKTVMRNVESNGAPAVQVELWLDDAGDGTSWAKVYEFVDDGTLGGESDACGAADPAMPMTWGGPIATFRWDSAEDVDFKWLSVREIE